MSFKTPILCDRRVYDKKANGNHQTMMLPKTFFISLKKT